MTSPTPHRNSAGLEDQIMFLWLLQSFSSIRWLSCQTFFLLLQ